MNTDEPDSKRPKPSPADATSPSHSPPEKQKKRVRIAPEPVSNVGISDVSKAESSKSVSSHESGSESSGKDEDGPSSLIHETLQKDKPSKLASGKAKYVPSDETKERRAARTIFIGNLAPDVAIKRVSERRFRRHFR